MAITAYSSRLSNDSDTIPTRNSLSDSALPTGGFVASSGLESFLQHGFLVPSFVPSGPSASIAATGSELPQFSLITFLQQSLISYSHLNLPFFRDAHNEVWEVRQTEQEGDAVRLEQAVERIIALDTSLEAMLLNHVTRRASKAQGIALLTLYGRAFASPLQTRRAAETTNIAIDEQIAKHQRMTSLVEALKAASRRPVKLQGHLPICFAVVCAALGLSLGRPQHSVMSVVADWRTTKDRSMHLHLFLQARAVLSSAVRLNMLGPYAAQRVLLTDIKGAVSSAINDYQDRCRVNSQRLAAEPAEKYIYKDGEWDSDDEGGPATTWPLAEILAARHDQLHSRIFNS